MVVAVEMLHELHLTIDREPVGMDIQRTHEDGDHQALVVEVGVLLSLFDHNDLSVGRGHDQFLRVAIKIADRTTIEIERNQPRRNEDDQECP